MIGLSYTLKKGELGNLISYLVNDFGTSENIIEEHEFNIDKSYDTIMEKIKMLLPEAIEKEDDLYKTIADFAVDHDEGYFQVGVLVGFRLCRQLEQENEKNGVSTFLKKHNSIKEEELIKKSLEKEEFDIGLGEAMEEMIMIIKQQEG